MKKYKLTLTEDLVRELFDECGEDQIGEKEFIITGAKVDEAFNELDITLVVE